MPCLTWSSLTCLERLVMRKVHCNLEHISCGWFSNWVVLTFGAIALSVLFISINMNSAVYILYTKINAFFIYIFCFRRKSSRTMTSLAGTVTTLWMKWTSTICSSLSSHTPGKPSTTIKQVWLEEKHVVLVLMSMFSSTAQPKRPGDWEACTWWPHQCQNPKVSPKLSQN